MTKTALLAQNVKQQERRSSFEYVLHDFLELEAEVGPRKADALKSFLLSQGNQNLTLRPVEGFRFNGHLVLIEKKSTRRLTRLVLFDPRKGSLRVRVIQS